MAYSGNLYRSIVNQATPTKPASSTANQVIRPPTLKPATTQTQTQAPAPSPAPQAETRAPAPAQPVTYTTQPVGTPVAATSGLLSSLTPPAPVGQPAPPVGNVDTSTVSPALGQVSGNETVQGQMAGLLDSNNPYMRIAEGRALQQANSRGILNSTMAVGAAQKANIEAALPIAQQDAQAYRQQTLANQEVTNQGQQFNAQQDNAMKLENLDTSVKTWSQQSQQSHDQFMSNLDQWKQLGKIDAEAYANLKGKYVDSISELHNNMLMNISEIQTATDITAEAKATMIQQQQAMGQSSINAMIGLYKAVPMWQQNWLNFPNL